MAVADHIHELATHLVPILSPLGFKYLKSRRALRRTTKYGRDVVDLLNSRFHLYLGFGVRHEAVENLLSEWGSGSQNTTATVCQNGLNVHPNRPISYPGPTIWEFSPTFDLNTVVSEASRFVAEVVLPWLQKFGDPIKLREALANDDGWVIAHRPWEIVVALDSLAGKEQEVPNYLAAQEQLARVNKWVPDRAEVGYFFRDDSIAVAGPPSNQRMKLTGPPYWFARHEVLAGGPGYDVLSQPQGRVPQGHDEEGVLVRSRSAGSIRTGTYLCPEFERRIPGTGYRG